jgi:myosin heavy subunit
VNPKPSLLHLNARLVYPLYLHKSAENINNAGDLTLPEGTVVQWELHTENASEVLFSLNQKKTLITADNEIFKHQEKLLKSGSYAVKPINRFVSSADSAAYRIAVIPDLPPIIAAEQKADSISSKAFYFNGKIQDDYGFSSLTFHYSVRNSSSPQKNKNYSLPVKADLGQASATFFYFWSIKEASLNPGDELVYYFDVADNDGVNGGKHSRTPEQTLHIPTETEQNKQLDAGTQSVKNKMQSAIKLSAQVERDAQKLNRLLLDKKTLSFDEKKQVEDLLQKRRELEEMVKDMQKENEQNLYNRQETKQQNQDILEKQKQINELFKNVLDEKTKELLKSLEQLLQQNQKDETREDVSKMQMDNKSLQKELNRMLELYKQLEFDQKLNENINQLDKLAEKQQALAEKTTQKKLENNQLKQEQEGIKKDFKELDKSLKELEQKNEQLDHKNNFETPKAEQKEAEQQMDKSEESLDKNSKQKAAQAQQEAANQMQKMSSKMKQMQQEGEEKEAQVNAQQLRAILKNLITSSFNQEKVMQTLKQLTASDPDYVNQTQQQQNIKDNLKTVEDSLFALSKRVPQIETTVNKEITAINTNIDKAIAHLGERRTAEANRSQQFAMTSMNNLALMLNEVLDQLQNMMKNAKPGSGKKKQPSMQQLSQMQQELNKNMQKARQQMQQQGSNGKPSEGKQGQQGQQKNGMSEQMAKMARQQEMIRRALQNINQQENKDGKGGLGNLGEISKQMEQTEIDLVNKKIETETLIRQQKIHTRLLEAEKAEQEREQDQKRESQAGKNTALGYQKALQSYQQLKNKQTEQLITIPPDVNLFYKSKIKTYFNEINRK